MRQSEVRLRELIDTDLPAHEFERLARVDSLLRAAGRNCERTRASISAGLDNKLSELESTRMREHLEHCASCRAFQADAEMVAAALRSAPRESLNQPVAARPRLRLVESPPEETLELRLGFAELALIYKALQAAKTLGALPPQDELLADTIQIVNQALNSAV